MLDSIIDFRNVYASRYSDSTREFLSNYGVKFIEHIEATLKKTRSNIYVFGNGGSYAISKCLKYAIEEYASSYGFNVSINTGIDVNRADVFQEKKKPGCSFLEILKRQGADARDLVVLISGSGNSDNLCEVAKYSRKNSIPTLAVIGSTKGELINYVENEHCFITPIQDQQISEDIIQSLSYGFEMDLKKFSDPERSKKIYLLTKKLEDEIRLFSEVLLENLASKIVHSFQTSLPIWVLGVGHSSLNICAEHTAHNLYWDGIYKVKNPPPRFIWSTATGANLSGISNDRRINIISHLMGFRETSKGLAIIYATSYDRTLKKLIKDLDASQIDSYLIFTKGTIEKKRKVVFHKTEISSGQIQAGITQIFGHILGRIVRMKLLEKSKNLRFHKTQDQADFLVNEDLAQRRLLNE